jgi:hypothetical protein
MDRSQGCYSWIFRLIWFDMVVHELLLCKLWNFQNYSVVAGMLVGSYLGKRAKFVRSGGRDVWSSLGICFGSALVYIMY